MERHCIWRYVIILKTNAFEHKLVGWKSRDGVPVLVEKYLEGNLKVEEFITHTISLADINTAFDLMHKGERCVSVWVLYIILLVSVFAVL